MRTIAIEALTKAGFAGFGDVVESIGAQRFEINQGFAERFNDLAQIDVAAQNGQVSVSIFSARPRPLCISMMERHPLGTQLFQPLQDRPWLVVVCEDPRDWKSYRAFRATGQQGVNYARNVWHHPLLVLEADERFIVIDRTGPGDNLEEAWLEPDQVLELASWQ